MNYLENNLELPINIVREIEKISKEKNLKDTDKAKLIKEVEKQYMKNSFEPGEAIGIISAQSLSEPATQMTMRSYHFSGSAGLQVTLGLPRLIEIFDARKEPTTPVMTIYLKKEFNNEKDAEKFAKKIKEKKLKNFVDLISLYVTNNKIKIKLKETRSSDIEKISERLKEKFKKMKIKIKDLNIDIEPEGEMSIKDLQRLKRKIIDVTISGIHNVLNTVIIKEEKDWVIKSLGSNFSELMKIEEIDFGRCYTNNLYEIQEVLGIEAARGALIKEILSTLQQQGLDVDIRHILLISDIMVFNGGIRAIGRYGIAGLNFSVLARAGFEETLKHLVKASVRNEEDNFKGLFENVMINQQVPVGTGMFDLIAKIGDD